MTYTPGENALSTINDILIFYMSYPFWAWMITPLDNALSFLGLSNFYVFTLLRATFSPINSYKVGFWVACRFQRSSFFCLR